MLQDKREQRKRDLQKKELMVKKIRRNWIKGTKWI